MTFTELLNNVYELTKRPDLITETKLAIQAATLRAHCSDFYTRDMTESMLVFPAYQNNQIIQVQQALPRFRNLKYLRMYDPGLANANAGIVSPTLPGQISPYPPSGASYMFEILDPEDVLDSYRVQKENVAYVAGNYLNISSQLAAFAYAICGWYQYPLFETTDDTYVSWIAQEFPFAIIFEAASVVFKTIGRDAENKSYREMSSEQIRMVMMSAVTAHAG